ncbi:unnamed protein product [Paramecium primaurelia]|uniref:YTH domain-containing protein n=1 Tax=Paramecium primaurelia TaxID=5886 RepID=A0A8S1NG84_PARPR|nr:unnamed protein product [Paramecium primaurelia]
MEGKLNLYLDIFKQPSNKFFIIKYKTRGQADQSLNNKVIFVQKRFDLQLRNAAQVCEQVGVFLSCLDQKSFIAFGTIQNEPTDFDYLTVIQKLTHQEEQQQNLSKLQEFFQSFVKVEWIFKGVLNFDKTQNIKNDLNEMKPINHCKDVQELTYQTAEYLFSLLQKQKPYKPQPQQDIGIPHQLNKILRENFGENNSEKQKSSKSRSRLREKDQDNDKYKDQDDDKDKDKGQDKDKRKLSKDRKKEKKSYDSKSRDRRSKDRISKDKKQHSNEKQNYREDKSLDIQEFIIDDNKDLRDFEKQKERQAREQEQIKEKDQRERDRTKEQIDREKEKEKKQLKELEKREREEKEMIEKQKQQERERDKDKDKDKERGKKKKDRERDKDKQKDTDYNRDREKLDKGRYNKKDDLKYRDRNESKHDYDKRRKDKERDKKNRERSIDQSYDKSDRKDRESKKEKERQRGGDTERERDYNYHKKQKDYRREKKRKRSEERLTPRSRSDERRQDHNQNKNKKALDIASLSELQRELYSSVSLQSHKNEKQQQDCELEVSSKLSKQKEEVDLGVILDVLDSPKQNDQQFQPLIQPVMITYNEQAVLTKQSELQQQNNHSDSLKRILVVKQEKSQSILDIVDQQKSQQQGSMKIIKDAPVKIIQQINIQQSYQESKQGSGNSIKDRIILKKK